jgi:DNA-binding response OmpR family regulator
MNAMRRKWANPHRATLKIYDLEINTELQTVKRGGHPVDLTPREFELLHLLASNRGQILSRAEILAQFYGDDPDAAGDSNVVDVYIRFLRRKLDEGFWPRLILTRRRQGYLMRGGKA